MQSLSKNKIITSLLLSVIFIFLTITNFDDFSNQYDSLVGFIPDNYSNPITAVQPARIDFTITNDHFDYCYMVFVPQTDLSEDTTVTISIATSEGKEIFRQDYQGGNLFMSKYVNITPDEKVAKGTKCIMTIESDAKSEETSYRMMLGQSVKSEIDAWYCGDVQETGGSKPELHIVYPQHFGTNTFIVYCLCILLIVLLPLLPKFRFEQKLGWVVAVCAVPVSSAILLYFVEMLSNNSVIYISSKLLFCNLLIFMGLQLLLTAVTGRVHLGVTITVILGFLAGVINHFVLMFRGTAVAPIDIIAIGVARDVVSNYTFAVDIQILLAIAVLSAGCAVVARYPVKLEIKNRFQAVARVLCGIFACTVLIFICSKSSRDWSGATINFREINQCARDNGFIYSFIQNVHHLVMEEPVGYDSDTAQTVMESYTGTEGSAVQPDIIVIMGETWADPTVLTDVSSFSTDPMPYLHSVAADNNPNTLVGNTIVPVFGSGTCNSEFEAITGLSLANFSTYCFPYLQYVGNSTPSMVSYLKDLGYKTYSLHPGTPGAWARNRVYKYFDFDEMYFDENFPYKELRHEMINDASCFNSILDLLPEGNEDPAFIFNVTIRNHGGYAKNTDFDIRVNINNTDGKYADAERFASLMLYSDEEIADFISALEERHRPTILVMFGDHLPSLSDDYFNYIHLAQTETENPLIRYTTPYLVWANYDIDTADIPQTVSSNYIGLMAVKLAGLPMNGWYQFLDRQMAQTPVYSLYGTQDLDGAFVSNDPYSYEEIQYTFFRKSGIIPEKFYSYK